MTRPVAFLEIEVLFDARWTGIPNVVAAIAAGAIADETIDWRFAFKTIEVPREVVARFLAARSGVGGLELIAKYVWEDRQIAADLASTALGVYTNIKPMRRFFGAEAQVIYDLSPILTPQYHNEDNVSHFANRIREDIATSDYLFCISKAVMTDVHEYFGRAYDDMALIDLGVEVDPSHVSAAHLPFANASPEPYVVIVGTLEPRKNGRIVLEYLRRDPGFAEQYRIVFIGRDGWLDAKRRLMEELEQVGLDPDRVLFTGFLTEAEKAALIHNAAFCVYPSFFEGFGLPVLEAGVFGKVTVCSNSSSMPEVDPANCVFFDPMDLDAFGQALRKGALRAAQTRSWQRSLPDVQAQVDQRSWSRCYPPIARWVRQRTVA